MKTRKSIKSTVAIGKGMLVAALALNGFEINAEKTYLEAYRDDAYSARTAHPFQRNGAPFRFKLSKAQQVD